jgi:hypothetical protein
MEVLRKIIISEKEPESSGIAEVFPFRVSFDIILSFTPVIVDMRHRASTGFAIKI